MAQHPNNAAYVSADGKVSFDRYGRKLDSIGNVVAGDRQRAGDAGASPIQRKEEQPKGPPAQPTAARYTFPANATGLPVARSAWDKSIVQPAVGAASAAGVTGAAQGDMSLPIRRSQRIDNTFAAQAGWRAPSRWEVPGSPYDRTNTGGPIPGEIQMQTDGLNMGQSWRGTTPNANMPYPPTGGTFRNVYTPQLWTGAGQTPQGRVTPVFDNYAPDTYTQPLDVYDPRQLSWGVP